MLSEVILRGHAIFAMPGGPTHWPRPALGAARGRLLLFSRSNENRFAAGPVCGWGIRPPKSSLITAVGSNAADEGVSRVIGELEAD